MATDSNATPPAECGPDTLIQDDRDGSWFCIGPCGNTNLHPVKKG